MRKFISRWGFGILYRGLSLWFYLKISAYKLYRSCLKGSALQNSRSRFIFNPVECAEQMGGTDFGYYFVRYMYEIISKHSDCKGNLKEPLVSGAALGLEGQLTVYNYKGGPCYRCLFPAPPPMTACQRCADSGVLGVLE